MQATLTPTQDETNTRRINRMPLNLPLRVEGHDSPEVKWEQITRLRDLSSFGAGFTLSRPVKRGRLIKITLPMPRQMRCYDFFESQYNVWAIVRRCVLVENAERETYFIGVAFIGKVPPKSFQEDPSTLYDVSHKSDEEKGLWEIRAADLNPDESSVPKEDRRHSRYHIPISFTVDAIDQNGEVLESEPTVSENISLGGATVFTSLSAEVGSFLRISSAQYQTTIKAIVRGRRIGNDGIPRLHIEFIDHFFPLSGIEL